MKFSISVKHVNHIESPSTSYIAKLKVILWRVTTLQIILSLGSYADTLKKHSMKTIKYQSVTDILTQVDPSFLEHFRKNTCTHNSPCSSFSSCAWMLQSLWRLWAALRIPGAVSHMKLVATTCGHVAGQGGRLGEYSRLLNLIEFVISKHAATSSNPPIGFPYDLLQDRAWTVQNPLFHELHANFIVCIAVFAGFTICKTQIYGNVTYFLEQTIKI